MIRVFVLSAVLLLVGLVSGCDFLGLGADDGIDTQGAVSATVEGLRVHLFAPDTVAQGDSLEVRFAAENRTGDAIEVTTPSGCLVTPGVLDEENARVPFKGSWWGCTAAVTTHEIPAGEVVERTFEVQAVLRTTEGEAPVSPGTYTVQMELSWGIGEIGDTEVLERELVVRP